MTTSAHCTAASAIALPDAAPPATTAVAWVRLILQGAASLAMDTTQLLAAAGLDASLLQQPQARIPQTQVTALWQAMAACYPGDDLALAVGRRVRLEHAPVLSYAMLSAPDLREALRRLMRFRRLIGEAVELRVTEQQGGMLVRLLPLQPVPAQSVQMAMVALCGLLRWLSGQPVAPLQVSLRQPRPASVRRWQNWFGCAPEFAAAGDAMAFPAEVLDLAIAGTDTAQAKERERAARQALQQLKEQQVLAHIRYWLEQSLLLGEPDRGWVASCLGLSISSLQRRLRAHGVTFRQLLDEVRYGRARELLARGVALNEIALQLGYQEQSNFQRAFRRWAGITPGRWARLSRGCHPPP